MLLERASSKIGGLNAFSELVPNIDLYIERVVDLLPSATLPNHTIYTPAVQGNRRWANVVRGKDDQNVILDLMKYDARSEFYD